MESVMTDGPKFLTFEEIAGLPPDTPVEIQVGWRVIGPDGETLEEGPASVAMLASDAKQFLEQNGVNTEGL